MRTIGFLCAVGISLSMVACGGGGGENDAVVADSGGSTPAPESNENNRLRKIFDEGLYSLLGLGVVDNASGKEMIFVGRQTVAVWGLVQVQKIAGYTESQATPSTIFDAIRYDYMFDDRSVTCEVVVNYVGATGGQVSCRDSYPPVAWALDVEMDDISGRKVVEYMRRWDGLPDERNWKDPEAVFPAGSVAYLSSFEAKSEALMTQSTIVISRTDSAVGRGWCPVVTGSNRRLGFLIEAGNVLSLYDIDGGRCSFEGLTPFAKGEWKLTASGGMDTYEFFYPDSVSSDPRWQILFKGAVSPLARMPSTLVRKGNHWDLNYLIKPGDKFTSRKPYFNSAAVPGLKQLAGLE